MSMRKALAAAAATMIVGPPAAHAAAARGDDAAQPGASPAAHQARSHPPARAQTNRAHRARSGRRAHPARTSRVSDKGHLRFHSAGATVIIDQGHLAGTIPGWAVVHFAYNGSPNVTARFAIRAKGGTLYGRARCRLHNPTSPVPSYRGALQITGGTGTYAHARGSGQMYGLFYRHGYALVVHANGTLRR